MNKLQLSAKKPGRMPKTEKMRLCPFVQEMEKDPPLYGGKKNWERLCYNAHTGTREPDMVVRHPVADRAAPLDLKAYGFGGLSGKISGGHYNGETSQGFQFH